MNTTMIAMSVAALGAIGLVVTVGAVSLLSGAFHFLFAKPKLSLLKSNMGMNGFCFSLKWNSAREPVRFDKVKIRLFNPFGTPTQVEMSHTFDVADSTFARDVDMGPAFQKLLNAKGLADARVEVEVSSSRDQVSQYFEYRALDFIGELEEARGDSHRFNEEHKVIKEKPLYQTVQRSFISEPLPQSNKTIKLATNPEFAGEFASAGGSTEAKENFAVSKVWIDPGCIVCNACEAIYPEVFEVTDDSCIIRPGAPMDNGLLVQEAAEACPVEVIKFEKVG